MTKRRASALLLYFWYLLLPLPRGTSFAAAEVPSEIAGVTSLSYNFTLAAYNLTLPNADMNGAPLVLGQDGATSGTIPHVTSTRASFPYDDYPALALVDGSLRAYGSDGSWNTNATETSSGGALSWITTTRFTRPAPRIYSVVTVPLTHFPLLAVHGRSDLWSLCQVPGQSTQTNVVYDVAAITEKKGSIDTEGFDPGYCYRVVLFVISTEM